MIGQTPKAGETVEKDTEVALLIAVGNGTVDVPEIVGQTPPDAEKALRDKGLTLGAASPQPVDPEGKIESQIPARRRGRQGGHAGRHLLPGAEGGRRGRGRGRRRR